MNRLTRKSLSVLGATGLVLGLVAALPATAAHASSSSNVCTGTPSSPGVLRGVHWGTVRIRGACAVNGGAAVVHGNLVVTPGSALVAAFARNDVSGKGSSSLRVTGSVLVERRAAAILGCFASSFSCIDDPNQSHPTLNSHDVVGGSIVGSSALGIIAHDTTVMGSILQSGGGGGFNCTPQGIFTKFQSPVFTTYEDSVVWGNVVITDVRSCWMGTARVHVHHNALYVDNKLADPDAIEIVSNRVDGSLACFRNSRTWDSGDLSDKLFPRAPQPNTVVGGRFGQCRLNSPTSPTDKPGPGPF